MQAEEISLQVIHPDDAGIDIGNETHYVAVPPVRDSQPVRRFGCTTAELKDMAVWLSTPALPLGPGIMSLFSTAIAGAQKPLLNFGLGRF